MSSSLSSIKSARSRAAEETWFQKVRFTVEVESGKATLLMPYADAHPIFTAAAVNL